MPVSGPETANAVKKLLRALGDKDVARKSKRFFKSGSGDYGEGDKFIGIRVPIVRAQVKHFRTLTLVEVLKLLNSSYHEERLCAVFMLVDQYARGDQTKREEIYDAYLNNATQVNNWDLVDSSAHKIVGPWLEKRSRKPLYELAQSTNLWERRIAIMSTYHFIRLKDFEDTLTIADILLNDEHDLIHKAVGWMLREVGNRDRQQEVDFLQSRYKGMPRTMLRYAIEKFPAAERKQYLSGQV